MILSWNPPFSWPGFDILDYGVTVDILDSDLTLLNYTINATLCASQVVNCNHLLKDGNSMGGVASRNFCVECNESVVSFHFESVGERDENCTEYQFGVAASNSIGRSNFTTITKGFSEGKYKWYSFQMLLSLLPSCITYNIMQLQKL